MPLGSAETLSLTGMMGSGKTTVAQALGLLLHRPVVSTDARVEVLARKPIARIFAEDGEAAFRAMERQVIGSLCGALVVDLGGGAFCDPESAARLLGIGRVVFLDVSPDEAARRLAAGVPGSAAMESRPLAGRWPALLARRLPLYRRAQLTVPVDALAPEAAARRILDRLRSGVADLDELPGGGV